MKASIQFRPRTHRAREFLLATQRSYPQEFGLVESLRQKAPGSLPPWCFLPLGLWQEVTERTVGRQAERTEVAVMLAALGAWRMTQGIYRIDPTVYPDLIDTPVTAEIPTDALLQMPEWCVYIETPDIDPTLHGAWAFLDADRPSAGPDLWYLLDTDPFPMPAPVSLGGDSIRAGIDKIIAQAPHLAGAAEATPIAGMLERITSVLLYICSQSDITGKHGRPANPKPVRTRRGGWRIFPADGLRMWDVGVRMGAALRRAYAAEATGCGGEHAGVRPHIRRAHWHTILSGARKRADGTEIPATDRRRDLRWMPPIPINLESVDDLPAVIRRA